jgi:hypothetical protein
VRALGWGYAVVREDAEVGGDGFEVETEVEIMVGDPDRDGEDDGSKLSDDIAAPGTMCLPEVPSSVESVETISSLRMRSPPRFSLARTTCD